MLRRLLATTAFAFSCGTALAADLPAYEPAPVVAPLPAVYDWTGFYVGLNGGWAWGDSDFDFTAAGTSSTTDVDGGFIGGTLGFNYQWNWLVVGAEGDLAWSGIDGSDPCPNPAFACEVDLDWLGTVRARAGIAIDNFLIFGTGGIAFGGVDADTPPFAPGADLDETYIGWTAGAGVEVGIWQNWSVKAEYAYTDLGDESVAAGVLGVGAADVDLDFHAVKLGVNYRF